MKTGGFWAGHIGGKELLAFAKTPFNFDGKLGNIILCYVLALFMYAAIWRFKRNAVNETAGKGIDKRALYFSLTALSVYFLTALIGCTVSWIVRPIFVSRYAVQGIPLVYLSLCIMLSYPHSKTSPALMVLLASLSLFANIAGFSDREFTEAENSDKFVRAIKSINKDDVIVNQDWAFGGILFTITNGGENIYHAPIGKYDASVVPPAEYIGYRDPRYTSIKFPKDWNYIPAPKGKKYFVINPRDKNALADFRAYMSDARLSPKRVGDYWYNKHRMQLYVLDSN